MRLNLCIRRRPLATAVALSLGVAAWLHGLHGAGLPGSEIWAGGLGHVLRDGLLGFPIAFAAVTTGAKLTQRRRSGGAGCEAAVVALVFALLLALAAVPHQLLDRAVGGGAVHLFHSQPRSRALETAREFFLFAALGVRDALLAYAAAVPLVLLCRAWSGGDRAGAPTPGWRRGVLGPVVLLVPTVTAAVAGLNFPLPDRSHRGRHALPGHDPLVTSIPVEAAAGTADLRVTLRSARWVRQNSPGERDRLYLEVTLENHGEAPRHIGRADFRLRGPDATSRPPLADDFPAILLAPQEELTTTVVFEAPPQFAQLAFAPAAEAAETLTPIPEDPIGNLLRALCRAWPRL
jgi:hypothetical protein